MVESQPEIAKASVNWLDHAGTIGAIGVATLTILNLAAVSNWQSSTALALLREQGSISVLVGALLVLFPNLLFAVTAYLTSSLLYRSIRKLHVYRPAVPGALFLLLFSLLALPIAYLSLLLLTTLMSLNFARRDARAGSRANAIKSFNVFESYLISPLVLLILMPTPWYPQENLTFKESNLNQSAYVVSASDRDLVILTPTTRLVKYVDSSTLVSREICSDSSTFFKRLLDLSSEARPPKCLK